MKKRFWTVMLVVLFTCSSGMATASDEARIVVEFPRVICTDSLTDNDDTYKIVANHITLGFGKMYDTIEEAINHPVVVESAGYTIVLATTGSNAEKKELAPGYVGSVTFGTEEYCYIIVSAGEELDEPPQILHRVNPFFDCRGTYSVSAQGYGVIGSGKMHETKSKSITDSLEIDSKGVPITITICNGQNSKTYEFSEPTTTLLSIKGSINSYLRIVIK